MAGGMWSSTALPFPFHEESVLSLLGEDLAQFGSGGRLATPSCFTGTAGFLLGGGGSALWTVLTPESATADCGDVGAVAKADCGYAVVLESLRRWAGFVGVGGARFLDVGD
jgi:hypothetical protein